MMYLVQCPNCKNKMKYSPLKSAKNRKACVYCGRSFKVEDNLVRKL